MIGHFGDESFQAIKCTGTDNQKHYIHQIHKRETEKTALANNTIYTLSWYAFYNLRSGNEVGPILSAPEPTQGTTDTSNYDFLIFKKCSQIKRFPHFLYKPLLLPTGSPEYHFLPS